MTQQTINVGTAANDRTGDTLRAAFQKVNANFTELYSGAANETQLTNNGYTLSINSSGTLTLSSGITGFLKSTSGVISTATVGVDYIAPGINTSLGSLTISGGTLTFSDNISSPAWTTAGIRHKSVAATLTDTTSIGTIANAYTNTFGGNTIAATNTGVTYTNYGTVYINNPVAGTNVTITNPYSLITAGNILVNGTASITSGVIWPTLTTAMRPDSNVTGQTLLFSDAATETVITNTAPASGVDVKSLNIQSANAVGAATGGQLNLWAGNGATKGGDIQMFSGKSTSGLGGSITISCGPAPTAGGNLVIKAGDATGGVGSAGYVVIRAGVGGAAGLYGDVRIAAGANPGGPIWYFKDTGRMIYPAGTVPATSKGQSGDTAGMFLIDATYIYYCIASYTTGTADIWKRTPHAAGTW